MERIEIFQVKKGFTKISMIIGLIIFFAGMPFLIYRLIDGFRPGFPDGDWNSVLVPFLGIMYFLSGYSYLRMKKFFIAWDDEKLSYHLPKSKGPITINLSDIRKVELNLLEVKIHLPEEEISIDLGSVQYKEVKRIKEMFKQL